MQRPLSLGAARLQRRIRSGLSAILRIQWKLRLSNGTARKGGPDEQALLLHASAFNGVARLQRQHSVHGWSKLGYSQYNINTESARILDYEMKLSWSRVVRRRASIWPVPVELEDKFLGASRLQQQQQRRRRPKYASLFSRRLHACRL